MYNEANVVKQLENLKVSFRNLIRIHGDNLNEEIIKIQVVTNFLDIIGYKKDYIHYESTLNNKNRVDMSILNTDTHVPVLYIEVKSYKHTLGLKDCIQLANYIHTSNINWGILTNGQKYILFNKNINGKAEEKQVLTFDLFYSGYTNNISKGKNMINLKLLSYDYLVNDKTNYFIYLSDFKNTFTNLHSFRQYESTLFQFLNYLADNCKFRLNNINPETFKEFLVNDLSSLNHRTRNYKTTIVNKFAYLNSFYTKVIEPIEKRNPFKDITRTDFLNNIVTLQLLKDSKVKDAQLLTIDELKKLISSIDNSRDSLRTKVIISLFIYAGLDKQELSDLKVTDINKNITIMKIEEREIPIPSTLKQILLEYLNCRDYLNIKCDYLLCGNLYRGSHSKLSASNIHKIIRTQFDNLDISDERKKVLNSSFIKRSLIISMFNNRIPLQEIAKFTGLTLTSLSEYISTQDIRNVKFNKVLTCHPYEKLLKQINITT